MDSGCYSACMTSIDWSRVSRSNSSQILWSVHQFGSCEISDVYGRRENSVCHLTEGWIPTAFTAQLTRCNILSNALCTHIGFRIFGQWLQSPGSRVGCRLMIRSQISLIDHLQYAVLPLVLVASHETCLRRCSLTDGVQCNGREIERSHSNCCSPESNTKLEYYQRHSESETNLMLKQSNGIR